jgi:hypothetical protein
MLDLGFDVKIFPKKYLGSFRETTIDIFPNPIENGQLVFYFPNRKARECGDRYCGSKDHR